MSNIAILSDDNRKKLTWLATAAAAVLLVGAVFVPERIWSNLFVATFFLLTIALGGMVFIALAFVTGAGWNVAFRRVPEALAKVVPIVGLAILIVLGLRMNRYGWHHDGGGDAGTYWFKELWLTPAYWQLRSACYIVIWSLLGGWLVGRSRKRDANSSNAGYQAGNVRGAALFLVVYAVTFSLASVDWIMSLDPLWFSTMWGVYNFAGMVLAALATVVILCILLSAPGRPLQGVFSTEHLHDLGRLLVGFSCFWMYIWFSQYMLIWYSNIPEETSYFVDRTHGPWGPVVVISIVLNWIVPFFVLLPRSAKRSRSVMMKIAVVLLIGRWVDLVVMVFPPTVGETPVFGVWEVASIACAAAIGLCLVDRAFRGAGPVPRNDPHLDESLHYHA